MVGNLPIRSRDLIGKIFGSLTVIAFAGTRSPRNTTLWLCQCSCGAEEIRVGHVLTDMVRQGYAPSCRKCRIFRAGKAKQTHGMSKHPAFMAWASMRARCRDPKRPEWKRYGGRGIKVCPQWEASFESFWRDMEPTWRTGLELDRKNNDGHYEPENCRWVTRTINRNNSSRVLPVSMHKLAQTTGIKLRTLYTRWYRGQSMTSGTPDPARVSWSSAMTDHS
jgi:hypothetical protein